MAAPGTTIFPPGSPPKRSTPSARRQKADWRATLEPAQADASEESYDDESESDSDTSSSGKDMVEFIPEECLFCNHTSNDFDENLSHMHQTHSLMVPFQSSLAVDLRTLVWFLHMVIFSYRECICCGKRRRTVGAVQQHMVSMGHCRFDVTEEMNGFYDMDSLGKQAAEVLSHPDDGTLRLPSGKLLANRSYVDPASKGRLREKPPVSAAGPSTLPTSQSEPEQSDTVSHALTKRDRKEQALTTQLARLRKGDQMSLMHLSESQQRALLVAQKKELDQAKRAERRNRRRLDNVGNKTAIHTNYYKQEVPVYMGG